VNFGFMFGAVNAKYSATIFLVRIQLRTCANFFWQKHAKISTLLKSGLQNSFWPKTKTVLSK